MAPNLRIEIFPSDLTATINFYVQVLAFTIARHEPDLVNVSASDGQYSTIDKGYVHIVNDSIHIGADGSHPVNSLDVVREYRRPPTAVELVIEVDNLEAAFARVNEQQWPVRPGESIKMQPWGLRDFRIEDPDGYFIRFSEPSVRGDGTGSRGDRKVCCGRALHDVWVDLS